MRVWKLMGPLTSCAFALGALSGCSLAVSPGPPGPGPGVAPASGGTITVDWLVAGTDDPRLCASYGADQIEVVVYDQSGSEVATANAPCGSFSVTVPLPEGSYSADVTLVDRGGNSVTTTKPLNNLDVVPGTDLAVSLDFPTSSIL